MSDQMKRITEFLKKEYGICDSDELISAVEKDNGVSIGIFTSRRESGGRNIEKI